MVTAPRCQYRGCRFDPWSWNSDPACLTAWPKKKKTVTKHTQVFESHSVMECFCEFFGDLPTHNGGPFWISLIWQKYLSQSWIVACTQMKWEPTLAPYTKINSKGLKDINIRHDTIKLLTPWHHKTENIGKNSLTGTINHSTVFLGRSPKAIGKKAKINGI